LRIIFQVGFRKQMKTVNDLTLQNEVKDKSSSKDNGDVSIVPDCYGSADTCTFTNTFFSDFLQGKNILIVTISDIRFNH